MKKSLLKLSLVASLATFSYAGADYTPTDNQATTTATISGNAYGGLGLSAFYTYGKSLDLFSEKAGQDRVGALLVL